MKFKRLCQITALVLMAFIMCSCGSKVNKANFDRIQKGMTQKQVESMLGTPSESSSISIGGLSGTSSKWTSKECSITVQFVNEKVWAKQLSAGAQ